MDWTEIVITTDVKNIDAASDIASMAAKGGIYVEDYSNLVDEAREIAHIDLIDEELLKKDRTKALIHIYVSPEDNPLESVAFLKERLNASGISYELSLKECRNEDWENNWKKYYKPLKIGEKLLIRPIWTDVDDAEGRAVLNIEPGVSFGTGTHETTRLCLRTLEKFFYPGCKKTMLDIGCGSGILSVASLLLGADSAEAVDIDRLAVKMARENGVNNGFTEPQYKVVEGDLTDKISGKFDVVVANIVADAIIVLSKDVKNFMKPDSVYITSGVIDLRENDVLDAFRQYGLEVVERYEEGGWLCFVTKIKQQ
ncbi:MAG: 50S ribosomal protein L11 methyltransferase [Clostridiales bacterium]|nr:50S ribosomal protein L11 methyltransferase [Clostridiales bacterium]